MTSRASVFGKNWRTYLGTSDRYVGDEIKRFVDVETPVKFSVLARWDEKQLRMLYCLKDEFAQHLPAFRPKRAITSYTRRARA